MADVARRVCLRTVSALWLLLLAGRAAHAVDLTGSWWVHGDPYVPSFANVTFDITQSGNTLTLANVTPLAGGVSAIGYGEGTIEPTTGVFTAGYGYHLIFEPIGTMLTATASPDGSSFAGEAILSFVGAPGTTGSPVVGVRLTGEPPVCGNDRLEPGEFAAVRVDSTTRTVRWSATGLAWCASNQRR